MPVTPWRFHKVASNNIKMIPLPLSQDSFQQNQNDTESQQTLPQGRRVPITPLRFRYNADTILLHEHMPLSTPSGVMHGTMTSCVRPWCLVIRLMQTLLQGDFYNAHTFLLHKHMPLSTLAADMSGTMPSRMTLTHHALVRWP